MSSRYGDATWDSRDRLSQLGEDSVPSDHSEQELKNTSVRNNHLPTVRLNGVTVHAITADQCIKHIMSELDAGRGGMVVTPNLDHLRRVKSDLSFAALVAEADLVVADGMPLVWASRLQRTPLPERVAGSDLVISLSAAAAREGRKLFFLGGTPGTADGAADVLREEYPNIQIVGTYCPPMGFEKSDQQIAAIIAAIAKASPDLVYVCLGSPKQEQLIHRIRPIAPNAWWLGLGNSFSFLCGDVHRAPRWMQRLGVEWVHRLLQEPRRLFKRYIVHGLPFAASLLGKAALRGVPVLRGLVPSEPSIRGVPQQIQTSPILRQHFIHSIHAAMPLMRDTNGATSPTHETQNNDPQKEGGVNLDRLRALILLGGTVRPTALSSNIGRAVLDLPITQDQTLLQLWLDHARLLSQQLNTDPLPVRILVNRGTPDPISGTSAGYPALQVERDYAEYRGTGGVLSDVAQNYADDDLILVANAAQFLLEPLYKLVCSLRDSGGQVSLVSHRDGTPNGLMLISCGALRLIPHTGFVDMKEQALPQIAEHYNVTVVQRIRPSGLPIRSLSEYIGVLRHQHGYHNSQLTSGDPLAEQWQPVFSIVEPGAVVDPTARIHDSVVLNGARVQAGAVLVRSVACPDAVLKRDRIVVDSLWTLASNSKRKGA